MIWSATSTTSAAATARRGAASRNGYGWYVVFVLMIAYIISFLDRQIVSLLVVPLKADLGLSDTQIGLLQGVSFAIFYTTLGIPIGRLADSVNRRNLIIVGITVWSLFTAGCGASRTYLQLFVSRLGVGVGEAALSPAAYSIIADLFPPRQLSRAMSLYSMGGFIGLGLALLAGGALIALADSMGTVQFLGVAFAGWQLVFLMLSGLGIVGVGLMLTIREPVRHAVGEYRPAQMKETFHYLRAHRATFVTMLGGFACFILMSSAMVAWAPTVLIRIHGWAASEVGLGLGLVALGASVAGVMVGGIVTDALVSRGRGDTPLLVGVVAAAGIGAAMTGFWWAASDAALLGALGVAYFCVALPLGVAPAAVQMASPPTMRAQLSAVYLSVVNLIGLALGPSMVAAFTDFVFVDEARVQQGLALTGIVVMPLAAILLFAGRRPFRATLREVAGAAAAPRVDPVT